MNSTAVLAEARRLIDVAIGQLNGPRPPGVPTGTQMNPSQAVSAGDLWVSFYGRGGEFKGIMVVNVSPVIGATDAGVLYAHPSSLKTNLPLGNVREPSVSEDLYDMYDPVREELMEDDKEAASRRVALMQKKYVHREEVVHEINGEAYRSGKRMVQGGKSCGTRVITFCADSVVNGKWDRTLPCKATIVAQKKDGFWKVSVNVIPSPLAAVNATYTSLLITGCSPVSL